MGTPAHALLDLKRHPLSAMFPDMSPEEMEALKGDIKANGQRERGVLLDGMVLDGWHRYLACKQLGVAWKYKEFSGDDPKKYVLSMNQHRRHSTESQRAIAVASVMAWKSVGRPAKETLPTGRISDGPATTAEMAAAAGVSERSVARAKVAVKAGLAEEVRTGKMTVRDAENSARGQNKPAKAPLKRSDPIESDDYQRLLKQFQELSDSTEDLRILADAAAEFAEDEGFQALKKTKQQLSVVTRRRDELMRENAELKREVNSLRLKLKKLEGRKGA